LRIFKDDVIQYTDLEIQFDVICLYRDIMEKLGAKANLGRHNFEFCFTRLIQEVSYEQLFRIAIYHLISIVYSKRVYDYT